MDHKRKCVYRKELQAYFQSKKKGHSFNFNFMISKMHFENKLNNITSYVFVKLKKEKKKKENKKN